MNKKNFIVNNLCKIYQKPFVFFITVLLLLATVYISAEIFEVVLDESKIFDISGLFILESAFLGLTLIEIFTRKKSNKALVSYSLIFTFIYTFIVGIFYVLKYNLLEKISTIKFIQGFLIANLIGIMWSLIWLYYRNRTTEKERKRGHLLR